MQGIQAGHHLPLTELCQLTRHFLPAFLKPSGVPGLFRRAFLLIQIWRNWAQVSTVCAKPQSALTAELESALVIALGPSLPQLLVADPTAHPHTSLWHAGSLSGGTSMVPWGHQPALRLLPVVSQHMAPKLAGSPPVRPSSSALCTWHGVCNREMGWAKGDSAGHVGLFNQGPPPSVGNLISSRTDKRKKETGAFCPSPTPPQQVVPLGYLVPPL